MPAAGASQPEAGPADVVPGRTVGDLVSQRQTVTCTASCTLEDAVDLLVLSDRSAAAIVDEGGAMLGVLTETDVVQAYSTGTLPKSTVGDWLSAHAGRSPDEAVSAPNVRPSSTLLEAAALMREQSLGDFAARHLAVRGEAGELLGVLSALDLGRALCSASPEEEITRRLGTSTAADIMKPSGAVPVCGSSATLQEVLEQMGASQQNCVLIADGELAVANVLGVVTPRDALRAFVEHTPLSVQVGSWLQGLQSDWEPRAVEWDERVQECAARMVDRGVHHLVVVSSSGVTGVLSSTDLAQAIGSEEEDSGRTPQTVGDLVCPKRTVMVRAVSTLADVVDLLMLHDRSSAAVVGDEGEMLGVLTENDIACAYSKGALARGTVGDWLRDNEGRSAEDALKVPPVKASTTLLEAAAVMREHATEETTVRHLVVRDDDGGLVGVLSALDLARALCGASPEAEIARRLGTSTAADIMKPSDAVPVCGSSATLLQVLEQMEASHQNCVLIADGELAVCNVLGVVTPRDALQAFVEHVPTSLEVGHWLKGVGSDWEPRAVEWDERVQDCAARMADRALHHLVVVSTSGVAGILSSTDLAQAIGATDDDAGCVPRTVGDLVCPRRTVVCRAVSTLADVVDLLILHDRSSAAIVGDEGEMLGVLTENHIVQAYSVGVLPKSTVGEWLRSSAARLPEDALSSSSVEPSSTLLEAAGRMREHATGESEFRHLAVRDGDAGDVVGVLSALDLARALCSAAPEEEMMRRIGSNTAEDIMKPHTASLVCSGEATLQQVLEQMAASRQNCVLIADGDLSVASLLGVVTPRDALRAFVEHVPVSVQVGHWLHGLQSDWTLRSVDREAPVRECAERMVRGAIHHLVVVSASDIRGVLSSTDLAQAIGSAERVVDGFVPADESAEGAGA